MPIPTAISRAREDPETPRRTVRIPARKGLGELKIGTTRRRIRRSRGFRPTCTKFFFVNRFDRPSPQWPVNRQKRHPLRSHPSGPELLSAKGDRWTFFALRRSLVSGCAGHVGRFFRMTDAWIDARVRNNSIRDESGPNRSFSSAARASRAEDAEIIALGPPVHFPGQVPRTRTRGSAVAALHARTAPGPPLRGQTHRRRVSACDPAHGSAGD